MNAALSIWHTCPELSARGRTYIVGGNNVGIVKSWEVDFKNKLV